MIDADEKQEIIIVRRVVAGDDGHHGGAWKIAFADFMTAMMALFLVLWLVNAANEKTKKSVASYFNPVKLVDRNRSSRGLDKSKDPVPLKNDGDQKGDGDGELDETDESSQRKPTDVEFFSDPFKVLEEIAQSELGKIRSSTAQSEIEVTQLDLQEDAFLDPFSLTAPVAESDDQRSKIGESDQVASPETTGADAPDQVAKQEKNESLEEASNDSVRVEEMTSKNVKVDEAQQEAKAQSKPAEVSKEKLSAQIQAEIEEKLKWVVGSDEPISESLSVEATADGILISITDQYGFSMFEVGSAVPKGAIILAMAEISNVLAGREGAVRVYGHTDGRPYGSGPYDNWRLSTARAHSARLMLTRGGLLPARIAQVSGFADRQLRKPDRPEANANRRIEILLEVS